MWCWWCTTRFGARLEGETALDADGAAGEVADYDGEHEGHDGGLSVHERLSAFGADGFMEPPSYLVGGGNFVKALLRPFDILALESFTL